MTDYELFTSPVRFDYDNMTRLQARKFLEHFVAQIPTRLAMLEAEVGRSVGFGEWRADGSEASLEELSRWLENRAERYELTSGELEILRQSISGPLRDVIPEMHVELTPLNYSYARDTAAYLGEIIRRGNPEVQWQVGPKPKRSLYYNRPVLATPEHRFMEDPFWTVTGYMIEHVRTRTASKKRIDLAYIAREWDLQIKNRPI